MKASTLTCPHCFHTRQPLRSTLGSLLRIAVDARANAQLAILEPTTSEEDLAEAKESLIYHQGASHAISAILKLEKL